MFTVLFILVGFIFSGCDQLFSRQVIERPCSDDGHLCVQTKSEETSRIWKIWGNRENEYWAVGEGVGGGSGLVLRWDGHGWIKQTIPSVEGALLDLWGLDASHIWAVGENMTILFWDGSTWELQDVMSSGKTSLNSIYGISEKNVLAVGESDTKGLLIRWNGAKWTVEKPVTAAADPIWRSVWATPNGEYFVAGDNGCLINQTLDLKWSFEVIASPNPMVPLRINAISGLDSGAAWLVGSQGLLRERSGNRWQVPQYLMDKGKNPNLNSIWTDGTGNIWTVGDVSDPNTCPAVYRLVGGQLVRHEEDYDRKSCSDARRSYRTVWGITGQEVWVGGTADGTIQRRRVAP